MATAPEVQALYEEYGDRGFLPMTLMTDGASRVGWANTFGLTHPVLDDDGFSVYAPYMGGGSIGLPNLTLLGPGLEVLWTNRNSISAGDIEEHLPEDY
ncbi:MAG: hypothetical protein VX519_05300 [Myxococcota bacterium]|nr:hypothetical protein [Myxococcota bacterium]